MESHLSSAFTRVFSALRKSLFVLLASCPVQHALGAEPPVVGEAIRIPIRAVDLTHVADPAADIAAANLLLKPAGVELYFAGSLESPTGPRCLCAEDDAIELMRPLSFPDLHGLTVYYVKDISWNGGVRPLGPGQRYGGVTFRGAIFLTPLTPKSDLSGIVLAHQVGHVFHLPDASQATSGNLMNSVLSADNHTLTVAEVAAVRRGAIAFVRARQGNPTTAYVATRKSLTGRLKATSPTIEPSDRPRMGTLSADRALGNPSRGSIGYFFRPVSRTDVQSDASSCDAGALSGPAVSKVSSQQPRCYDLGSGVALTLLPVGSIRISRSHGVHLKLSSGAGCDFSLVLESSGYEIQEPEKHVGNLTGEEIYVDFVIVPKKLGEYDMQLRTDSTCGLSANQSTPPHWNHLRAINIPTSVVNDFGLTAYQSAVVDTSIKALGILSLLCGLPLLRKLFREKPTGSP